MCRKWLIGVVLLVISLVSSEIALATSDEDASSAITKLILAGFLDPKVPPEQRRALAVELEEVARRDHDPYLLYFFGSLYRQGSDNPGSPLPKDMDRAREYLSRAALSGNIPAMAKLSTMELQAKNRFEANVWAQLHFYYAKEQAKADPRWSESFAASILRNAQDGFPKGEAKALNASVGAMIERYGVAIREGLGRVTEARAKNPLRDARPGQRTLVSSPSLTDRAPASGMAEYYVTFAADGSVRDLWRLDSWPSSKLAHLLRPIAMGFRVEPVAAFEAGDDVALLPVEFGDRRYRATNDGK
jgi:hypothetical protein